MTDSRTIKLRSEILEIRKALECNDAIIDTVYLPNGEMMGEALVNILLDLGMSVDDIDAELESTWRVK